MGALLLELDEQWSTGHRYLEMQSYGQWQSMGAVQCAPIVAVQAEGQR